MLPWLRSKLHSDLDHSLEQDRQRILWLIVLMMLIPGTITVLYFGLDWLLSGSSKSMRLTLWSLTAHPAMLLCIGLARRNKWRLAYVVPPVWMWLSATVMLYFLGPNLLLVFQFVGGILLAGLLLGTPWALASASASVLGYTIVGSLSRFHLAANVTATRDLMSQSLVLGLSGTLLLLLFMHMERRSLRHLEQNQQKLEQRMSEQSANMAANEQRLQAQFKGMPVPTFAWRRIDDNFVLVDYNDAAMHQTRGGVRHFLGATASQMYADRPDIMQDMADCYREQSQIRREMRYAFALTEDVRQLRVTYAFIAPDTILVHTEDISAQKQARDALRESERRMAALLANLPGMAYRCADDERWTIQYVSEGCLALTGYTSEDLVNNKLLSFAQLVHPQDLAMVHASVSQAHWGDELPGPTNEGSFEMIYRIITADGQTKWVWEQGRRVWGDDGQPVALEGLILDVTASHQAQIALQASEARNSSLVEAFPDAIVVTDLALNILMANPSAQHIWGAASAEALQGRLFYDLIAPEDRERARHNATHNVGTAPQQRVEYEMLRDDGSRFPAELSASLVRDFEGRKQVFILFVSDITERRHLQEQLQTALKLEAVGRLAGGIAHDFNNLLTVINGYASFLAEALPKDSRLRNDAQQVLRAGERATHLTRQLLAFSRRQVMQTLVLSLNDVILDIEPMLRSLLGETIRLQSDLAPDLACARLDRAQMERAITNLVTNARDAMPRGGTLRLSTRNVELEQPLLAVPDDVAPGRYVVLAVQDDGEGMSDEVRERALEPFFTTKEVGQGTGLGLSMVYGTIKQLDGALQIDSRLGHGTTLQMYLPASDNSMTAQPALAAPAAPSTGRETILLVEDDPIVREYAARVLRQLGYQVHQAGDAIAALAFCQNAQHAIDLVLSDVVMPGMSGPEMVQEMSKVCHIPHVLYMSGHSDTMMGPWNSLCDDVVLMRKPFAPQELAQRVRQLLES